MLELLVPRVGQVGGGIGRRSGINAYYRITRKVARTGILERCRSAYSRLVAGQDMEADRRTSR